MGSSQWGPCSFTADPGAGIVIVIRFIVISHTTWRTVPKPSKPQPSWRNIWNSFNWPGRDKYYISLSHLQIYLQSSPSAQPYYFYLSKYYLPSLSARWYSESKGPHPAKTSLTGSREKPGACWLPVTNCHLTLLLLSLLVNTLRQPVSSPSILSDGSKASFWAVTTCLSNYRKYWGQGRAWPEPVFTN